MKINSNGRGKCLVFLGINILLRVIEETRAANRTLFSILVRPDHLPRPGQKMVTCLPPDSLWPGLAWSGLQDSGMLKNFYICFYYECIDTLYYIINHNIATWPNFPFIFHDDYSTRVCIKMAKRKNSERKNSEQERVKKKAKEKTSTRQIAKSE